MAGKRSGRTRLLKASNALFAFALIFLCCSCDGVLMHKYEPVENGVWERGDTLLFTYINAGNNYPGDCSLLFEARIDASYRYRDLYVGVTAEGNDGFFASETLHCAAYDSIGRHIEATAGILYQLQSDTLDLGRVDCDTIVFRLSHAMLDCSLNGVYDIGVKLVH